MFGLSSFTVIGLALVAAFGTGGTVAYRFTSAHYEHKADMLALEQREAVDKANVNAEAAAELYEEAKAKQYTRTVVVTREVNHAIESAPAWRDEPVPDLVRESIAAASAALAPAEPDGAVRLPAAGGADERPTGPSLRPSAGIPGGLLSAP